MRKETEINTFIIIMITVVQVKGFSLNSLTDLSLTTIENLEGLEGSLVPVWGETSGEH